MAQMTIQTKRYIEPNDIVALRFTCRRQGCGAALVVGISETLNIASLRVCPHCSEPWTRDALRDLSIEPIIAEFVKTAKQLISTMRYRAGHAGGFYIDLEITNPPAPEHMP
jgi:hypothetical protein